MLQLNLPVGILGGGQLSMMLCEAAKNLNLKTIVLTESMDDPATKIADHTILGSFRDEQKILEVFSRAVSVSYENEFIDEDLLNRCLAKHPVNLLPAPWVMSHVANKLAQKKLFNQLGIASADYSVYQTGEAPNVWLNKLQNDFPQGFMLKMAKGGYDGKGNFPVFDVTNVGIDAENFLYSAIRQEIAIYAEERIRYSHELALVSVYSLAGENFFFPLVLSEQKHSICSEVRGPATDLGIGGGIERAAREASIKIAKALSLYGTFAIEFFLSDRGLMVNELAPRVHNSGHLTQDAFTVSQFEAHWRAVLGMPLESEAKAKYFGMINILGPEAFAGSIDVPEIAASGAVLHWYQKRESRPRRKLGHINIVAESVPDLERVFSDCQMQLSRWKKELL